MIQKIKCFFGLHYFIFEYSNKLHFPNTITEWYFCKFCFKQICENVYMIEKETK